MSITEGASSASPRYQWIDVYKGIAIFLVVLGHLEIPQGLYDYIFLFHMYAFFFIAGVTFKVKENQTFGVFVLENMKRLYIPYLFFAFAWDITNMVTQLFIEHTFDFSPLALLKNVASVLIGGGPFSSNASIGPAWFLLALLVVRIVCWLIIRFTRNNLWAFGALSSVLFVLGYVFQGKGFLPFKIFSTLTVFLFVFIGYLLKSVFPALQKRSPLILLGGAAGCFGLVFVATLFADKTVTLVANSFPTNPAATLLGGFAGCFGLVFLALLLTRVPKLSDALAFYGVNSLIVMGIHSEINFALRFLFHLISLGQIYRVILIFLLTLILSVPICIILSKYFPVLVGKRKSKA